MKILLSAYACEPNRGSEAEIGWGIALELAKEHQVWVLTRANNQEVHTDYFNQVENGKPCNLNFIYYDIPKWASFYKNKGKRFLIYYYHWQFLSFFACKKIFKDEQIDIVHHITGGMDFFPSGFSFFNAPFVWGPIGAEDTHPKILKHLPIKDKLQEYKRIFQRYLLRNFDPFTWFTIRRSDHIITYSTINALSAQKYYKPYSYKISNGIQTGLILDDRYKNRKSNFNRSETFTILYAANLIPWKGGRFVVDAFVKFLNNNVNAKMVIVGTGPLEGYMKAVVKNAGLEKHVDFKGWLSMQGLLDLMTDCDLFLYPTYHHGLANISLQAMVMGLPMLCLKGDGIETVINTGGGIAIDVNSYQSIGSDLADVLFELYSNEDLCTELAQSAQLNIINNYTYKALAENLIPIYKKTINEYHNGIK